MKCRASKNSRAIIFLAAFFVVFGQLSAYPLICAMPGMHMNPMSSQLDVQELMPMASIAMSNMERNSVNESDSSGMSDMANCEQVCNYCISYNHLGEENSNLVTELLSSQQIVLYSRFAPTDPLKSLFRPPISV